MDNVLIRSLLFVPGNNMRLMEKAIASQADAVILDLEDAVAEKDKAAARTVTADALRTIGRNGKPVLVRVNALETGMTAEDLAAVVVGRPWAIVLPKCRDLGSVQQLSAELDALEFDEGTEGRPIRILTIATETAESTLRLGQTTGPRPSRLWGAMWGDEDLSASLGALASRDEKGRSTFPFLLARALCLYSASVLGIRAVDSVYVDFRDLAGLEQETMEGLRDGFTAKAAIHPAQVEVINRVLTPTQAQVDWAHRVIDGLGDKGVTQIDGKMINMVHRRIAMSILQRTAEHGGAA